MADVAVLNVGYSLGQTTEVTSSQTTATTVAASFTVPMSAADHRAVLFVHNGNAAAARVKVSAGDGLRSCLGDLTVDLEAGAAGAIPLTDTMRFLTQSTQKITVQLTDTDDTALTATPLSKITTVLIQG